MYIFGQPFICMLVTYILGDSFNADFDTGNNVRYAFFCGPRFDNIYVELLIVHIPIIFSGFLLLAFCYIIALTAILLHRKMKANPVFRQQTDKLKTRLPKSKITKVKQKKKKINTALKVAKRVVVFGIFSSIFLLSYTIATLDIVFRLKGFAGDLEEWRDCALSIDLEACLNGNIASGDCTLDESKDCSAFDPRATVPPIYEIGFYYLAPDMIPLLFGIMFGFNHLLKSVTNTYYEIELFLYKKFAKVKSFELLA